MMLERDWDHVAGVINDWLKAVVSDAPPNGSATARKKTA
jgi:hypothetical protein